MESGTARSTDSLMIEAVDLRRTFGATVAVDGISFTVQRGQIFGLLGPNGAGKTTTIRMLSGQIVPTGGHATVAGCDVVRDVERLKERIGVVFEEQNLYERLSALDNLRFNCWLYGVPEQRADEVLEMMHLSDRARSPVRTFSSGMKQRLMIARALLHRPQVLFLDEPTRGLDAIAAREVRAEVERLRQGGMTILLTTHILEEADQLCQRVAIMNRGRIVANDTPRNLKLAQARRTIVVTRGEQDIMLRMDDPQDQERLRQLLAEGGVQAVHSQEPTLEDVFVEIAGEPPVER